jgi:hypothetical protein
VLIILFLQLLVRLLQELLMTLQRLLVSAVSLLHYCSDARIVIIYQKFVAVVVSVVKQRFHRDFVGPWRGIRILLDAIEHFNLAGISYLGRLVRYSLR